MGNDYQYLERDISWLSFNHRVLLEADDDALALYERINFISIYSSNLEEFYQIRVAEHRAIASGQRTDEESARHATWVLQEINRIVNEQLEERIRIYEKKILPALKQNHIVFYQSPNVDPSHQEFIQHYFREEIFPFLQPIPIWKDYVRTFLRNDRQYLAVRLYRKDKTERSPLVFVFKLPYRKVPRFVELPSLEGNYYLMFAEDIIKANIGMVFPGFQVDCAYCFKISRDADILIDETLPGNIVEQVKDKVKKRKTGAICRFVYDRHMPQDLLDFLCDSFCITADELVPGDKHLNLEDLRYLPNPNKELKSQPKPTPMKLNRLNEKESIFHYVRQRDLLIHFPYHSFEHFIHFLYEAVHDPATSEIMITQYRVAENSAVINTLIAAAQNGKRVTVFVELKARFDEENNLETAEMMKRAGIHIIYSIRGLKVHAKVALVLRKNPKGELIRSYAFVSTGNFNEDTAKLYADTGLFTCNPRIVDDLRQLFGVLKQEITNPSFKQLLVTKFNLIPTLQRLIREEIHLAKHGKGGRIILKMNSLQDPEMIAELYRASEAGVQIDLIVRGICCLKPEQPYSHNIRVTRIVDSFLEHTRIWYFGHNGKPLVYLGSADWMKRNLYRRIEAIVPVTGKNKEELIDMLHIQLSDNCKACLLDANLHNRLKHNEQPPIRAQYAFYNYLRQKNKP